MGWTNDEVRRKYQREWRKRNPDNVREARKRSQKKNAKRRKDWLKANAERVRAYQARYREKNRKKLRAKDREYHRKHHEKATARMASWKQTEKGRRLSKETSHRYMAKHREKLYVRKRKWYRDKGGRKWQTAYAKQPVQRAKAAERTRRRRVKVRETSDLQHIEKVKAFYLHVQIAPRLRCHWCRRHIPKGRNRTVDHVVPLCRGGRHCMDNLVASCRSCNSRKCAKLPHEFCP
jgi:hypothetical protein